MAIYVLLGEKLYITNFASEGQSAFSAKSVCDRKELKR
jgi:hypothetical protein